MKVNTNCQNLYGWVNKKLNQVFNSNWKLLKSELDASLDLYTGNIIRSILTPLLENVAVQDIFQN